MHLNVLKIWVCKLGLGVGVLLLGSGLHGVMTKLVPELLAPLVGSGSRQMEMLNTLWSCLG